MTTVIQKLFKIAFIFSLAACLVTPFFQDRDAFAQDAEDQGAYFAPGPVVVLETTQGTIELELYPIIAPKATENFLGHVQNGYYNGLIFHRIIKNFMIQGGDPTGTGRGGESIWGSTFEDEVTEYMTFDRPYLLAMANAGPNTNGSQFFITTAATPWLNMKHTIFGEVISGQEIVRKMENVATGPGDRPATDQKIIRAYVKE